jgi:putative flavoprotein involved in K+ transport
MSHADVIIIGGGQAGLAMSQCLTERGIDHVVLESGRVGERWRMQSWDSLRLLTPNWMTRLPGFAYDGRDPDGFMTAGEFIYRLHRYARLFNAPVEMCSRVTSLEAAGSRYRAVTHRGTWTAPNVVIATGAFNTPFVPEMAQRLSPAVHQLSSAHYRNPDELPPGGVLVIGASASGVQIAQEIRRSGRPVAIAVGSHTRLPRRYRGRDIMWWLDRIGMLDDRVEHLSDPAEAQRRSSLQLIGDVCHRNVDIGTLQSENVEVFGRLAAIEDTKVSFAGDLGEHTRNAHQRLKRMIARIDAFAEHDVTTEDDGPEHVPPLIVEQESHTLDLKRSGIRTVLWATGFRSRYPWLKLPVVDAHGNIVHDRGVCSLPGLYVLGLRFMRRRKSSFIDGCGPDAREIAAEVADRLHATGLVAA